MSKQEKSMIIKFQDILGISLVVNGNEEDGWSKVLVMDFEDENGDIYSIAHPQILVKKHEKKEGGMNGESGDQSSGSASGEAEKSIGEERTETEGEADSQGESEKA